MARILDAAAFARMSKLRMASFADFGGTATDEQVAIDLQAVLAAAKRQPHPLRGPRRLPGLAPAVALAVRPAAATATAVRILAARTAPRDASQAWRGL